MIWQPKLGQRVKVHYRKSAKDQMPLHNKNVDVVAVSKGPGPRNVLVRLYIKTNPSFSPFTSLRAIRVIVPRGNLVAI